MMNTLKNKRKNPLKALTSGALSLLIALNIISAPIFAETADPTDINTVGASAMLSYIHGVLGAEPNSEAGRILKSLNLQWADADTSDHAMQTISDVTPLTDVSDNAIKLEYGKDKNISDIAAYYLVGDYWVKVDENSTDLPADAKYKFEISYMRITVGALRDAGGQMVFDGFPDWFVPDGNGVLLYENEIVAQIQAVDGRIVITFDDEWLNSHEHDDITLSGSFKVSGNIDWHKLPPDGSSAEMPDLEIKFNFEKNLAQKYGALDLEKTEPKLSEKDGKYYLEYTLTVTNTDSVSIPDVTVRDAFNNNSYISGYVGITAGIEADGYGPSETGNIEDFSAGTWSADGDGMLWTIGELKAGEERTLTYYAEIAESYVSEAISNPIVNTARVYSVDYLSGEHLKDMDSSSFKPKNEVSMTKTVGEPNVASNGSGSITYTLTISAPDDNTFTLSGLTLSDYLPEEFRGYVLGDNDNNAQLTVKVNGEERTTSYNDASFTLGGITLTAGETVTVEYTLTLKNIFLVNNGEVTLTNTASVSAKDRQLASASSSAPLEKNTMIRKLSGDAVDESFTVTMESSDGIYEYRGNEIIEDTNGKDFIVPAKSLKYQVIVNENGQWDLSSTNMKDSFSNGYLRYVGYVQVQLFNKVDGASGMSSEELIDTLGDSAVKTVWLKIEDMDSFEFTPDKLGITDHEKYTYLLTYYAKPYNVDNVANVSVSNSFEISGKLGYGDGNGSVTIVPGISVTVSNVVTGGANYSAYKSSWYYEPKPVYKTGAVGSGYTAEDVDKDYPNGAIYWVIRLDGEIPSGYAEGTGRNTTLYDFRIQDSPDSEVSGVDNKSTSLKRDAVVGVYEAPKDLDFSEYSNYEEFMEFAGESDFNKLIGNPRNDKYFWTYFDEYYKNQTADYKWYSENETLNGIVFSGGYTPDDGNAVYIILRTSVTKSLPSGVEASRSYDNSLYAGDGNNPPLVNTATYTYYNRTSLYKESKGAYIYNKNTGTFENCSNRAGNGWNIKIKVNEDMLPSSGIYAAWLLNINWDGSMSGTADIIDELPKGMELVYVGVNNFGTSIKRNHDACPQFEYISGLDGYEERIYSGLTDINLPYTSISYYNPETRHIRWRLSNFTSGGGYKKREINLQIICKVTDPELFLSGIGKTYENVAKIVDPDTLEPGNIELADVHITVKIDKNIDLNVLQNLLGGGLGADGVYTAAVNKLPFTIEINPLGEDMCEGSVLPALIDELSEGLTLIEDSLKITKTADNTELTGYTFSVEKLNGKTAIVIKGLPDNTPLEITYTVRVNALPNKEVTVSNKAYWAGNPPPEDPQVNDKKFKYVPSGDVYLNTDIAVEITKVDADSHSKKLEGAEFEIYEVDFDGNITGDALFNGTTDSTGKVRFENNELKLAYDKVYAIKETKAPSGYGTREMKYFAIVSSNSNDLADYKVDIEYWTISATEKVISIVMDDPKGVIGVNKDFADDSMPTSGSYRFGLFDQSGKLLETLTIEYTESEPIYYLDGVQKAEPNFTNYDPEGVYRVYELDANDEPIINYDTATLNGIAYRVTYGSDNEHVTFGSTVSVSNAPNPKFGDLTVKKTVAGDYIDPNKEFTFAVTLTTADGQLALINETYGDLTFIDGVATFTLKHNEQKTATGLPVGLKYTVEETAADGYKTTWTKTVDTSVTEGKNSGTIAKDTTDNITATNEYKQGSLSVIKNVVGDANYQYTDSFTFAVTLKAPNGFALASPYSYKVGKDTKTMTLTKNDDGSYSGTLSISNGQTATIDGLPVGTEYKVEETNTNELVLTVVTVDGTAVSGGIASGTITYDDDEDAPVISAVTMTNATPVSASVTLKKTLSGPIVDSTPKTYTFNVTRTGAKDSTGADLSIPAYADTVEVTVSGGTDGYSGTSLVTLEEYIVAGTYTYEISEVDSKAAGVKYDETVYTVTVVVTVESDGSLKATVTKTKPVNGTATAVEGDLEFTNIYEPTGTSVSLGLIKTLATSSGISVGFEEDDFAFTATVSPKDNSPSDGAGFAVENDGEITLSATKTASNSADGSVHFGDITFTKSGKYTVTVNEETIPEQSSVYGNADAFNGTLTAIYDVRDVNGELKVVSVTYGTGNDAFTVDMTETVDATTAKKVSDYLTVCNIYKSGSLTISKTVENSNGSTLAGAPLTEAFEFTVELYMGTEGNKSPVSGSFAVSGTAVLPSLTDGSGTLSFGTDGKATVKLSHEQTLTITGIPVGAHYKVTETPFAEDSNYSVKQPTNGTVEGTITEEGANASFVNVYTMPPVKLSIPVKKTLIGADALNTYSFSFTFDLAAVDNAPLPTDKELTLNFANTDAAENKWTKSANFGEIAFEHAGTYYYTVTERSGSADGIRYDAVPHNVTVSVDNADGELVAHITEIDGKTVSATDGEEPSVNISNYYRDTAFTLNGIKTVSGPLYDRKTSDGTVNNSETFAFTVSLAAPEGFDYAKAGYTASQDDSGAVVYLKTVNITVTADNASGTYQASERFIDDEYHIAGTYTYTVKETAGSTGGFTYDATVYTVTVKVEDQTDYTLSVSSEISSIGDTKVTDAEGNLIVAFNNTYAVTNISAAVPDIHKVLDDKSLSGRVLENGEFGFTATVTLPDGSTADGAGFITKGADGNDILSPTKTVRNDGQGNIVFGGLTFTRAGEYILTIKEDMPEETAKDPLIQYDDKVVTITYEVADNGGALSVTQSDVPELIGRTFINTIEESQQTEPPTEDDPLVTSETSEPSETSTPETSASTTETTVPSSETTAPTSETTVPTSETTVPSSETTAPTSETTVPTSETTAPTSKTTAPTSETTAPTSETTVPTSETTVPTSITTTPTSETTVPSSETTAPTSETTAPTSETTVPTSETTAPTSESSPATSNSTVTTPDSSGTSKPPVMPQLPSIPDIPEAPSNQNVPRIERPAEYATQDEDSENELVSEKSAAEEAVESLSSEIEDTIAHPTEDFDSDDANPSTGSRYGAAALVMLVVVVALAVVSVKQRKNRQA